MDCAFFGSSPFSVFSLVTLKRCRLPMQIQRAPTPSRLAHRVAASLHNSSCSTVVLLSPSSRIKHHSTVQVLLLLSSDTTTASIAPRHFPDRSFPWSPQLLAQRGFRGSVVPLSAARIMVQVSADGDLGCEFNEDRVLGRRLSSTSELSSISSSCIRCWRFS